MNDSQFNDYQRNIVTDSAKLVMLAPYYGFLAGSERAAIYLKYLGRARVAIYHCAIDTERVGRLSAPHFEATAFADRHFVMIGRFIEKKNHKLLLQAFESYLETATAKRRLILVGYGPLENDIKARISSSPLLQQFVDLRGYMEPDDIAALLGSALALYLPSFEEQFGIVVTEALAAGIPVVVTHACGAAELVQTAVNGFIVEPNNLHALSWTMEEISSDEAFWSMLSSNTRMYAKSGDVKLFVEAAEAMAGDVISTT